MAQVVGGGCRRGGPAAASPTWLALGFVGVFVLSTCSASSTPSMDRVVLTPSDGLNNAASDMPLATAAVGTHLGSSEGRATDNRSPPTTGHHYNHPHAEVSGILCVFLLLFFSGWHISFGANARLLMVLEKCVCMDGVCMI